MRDFAAMVAKLDAEADTRLGDPLFYDVGGIISTVPVKGIITDPADLSIADDDQRTDPVARRRLLKIHRDVVPAPSRNDRVRSNHPLLVGYVWRPTNWKPVTGGRYWQMPLEKVG